VVSMKNINHKESISSKLVYNKNLKINEN